MKKILITTVTVNGTIQQIDAQNAPVGAYTDSVTFTLNF